MSKPIIPREALAAYQRWQPSAFGTPDVAADEDTPDTATSTHVDEDLFATLRDAAREEGHAAGYAAGLVEGRAQGFAEGQADGLKEGRAAGAAQVDEAAERLRTIAENWRTAFAEVDRAMANTLLELALQFSQVMVRKTLEVDAECVLPLVQELLRDASDAQRPATVRLHPADLDVVQQTLGGECELAGWKLFADASITRGGCLVQTRHGALDARMETRWQALTRALDRPSEQSCAWKAA